MPFFSQLQDPDSITHYFSNDWIHVTENAPLGADVLVPSKSMGKAIASKRRDLNIFSLHDLIAANVSKKTPD